MIILFHNKFIDQNSIQNKFRRLVSLKLRFVTLGRSLRRGQFLLFHGLKYQDSVFQSIFKKVVKTTKKMKVNLNSKAFCSMPALLFLETGCIQQSPRVFLGLQTILNKIGGFLSRLLRNKFAKHSTDFSEFSTQISGLEL